MIHLLDRVNHGHTASAKPRLRFEVRCSNRKIKAGTRLLREWQGRVHEVTVVKDGFSYQGSTYRSLSEIARTITGTRWNGWVFFGLKNHRRGA